MKKFYIVDENGTYVSTDGKTRFTCLIGEELYNYLNSEEGSKKKFDVDLDDNGDEIGIEVPEDKIKEHLKDKNHSDYLRSCEKEMGYTTVSLNADFDGKDDEAMTYEEIVADDECEDIAEAVAKNDQLRILRLSLNILDDDERALIDALFFANPPMKVSEYSRKSGIPRMTITDRRERIFEKIREYFKK